MREMNTGQSKAKDTLTRPLPMSVDQDIDLESQPGASQLPGKSLCQVLDSSFHCVPSHPV